jgi:hypothetical protein
MSLTKRQKTLLAVFLIGLVGLAVDRTILRPQGGPQAASAGTTAATSSTPAPSDTPTAEQVPPPTVAERLNKLAAGQKTGAEELRDPFVLPSSWSDPAGGTGTRTPDPVRLFLQRHRLQAVVMQNGEYGALIDDVLLVPGQSLDGFQLVSVASDAAVFERQGQRAVLNLAVK